MAMQLAMEGGKERGESAHGILALDDAAPASLFWTDKRNDRQAVLLITQSSLGTG